MTGLLRDISKLTSQPYDVVIIGAGIYGAALLYEAAQYGLRALLVEKADFGGYTSFNNFRIVHGGLRYLQFMDLPRYFVSVNERRWFLKNFPQYVSPHSFLMPLHNEGVKRPFIMRIVAVLNDLLSFYRNFSVSNALAGSQVVSRDATGDLFPACVDEKLKAGFVWHDALMPDCQRILMLLLKTAVTQGRQINALNYVAAEELLTEAGRVLGVRVRDQQTQQVHEVRAKTVINATGPYVRELAAKFDKDYPELFRYSIAWNVLFDRPPLSAAAVAVTPPYRNAQTYFSYARNNKLFVGTGHDFAEGFMQQPLPAVEQLDKFIRDLNLAIPDLDLTRQDIIRIYAGQLPLKNSTAFALASDPTIIDHATHHGPVGLYSVSGVKYTTARHVAERLIKRLAAKHMRGCKKNAIALEHDDNNLAELVTNIALLDNLNDGDIQTLAGIVDSEAVQHLDDLLLRRVNIADAGDKSSKFFSQAMSVFAWDTERQASELARLQNILG